jgi:SAM-dependent methyltransferase
VKDSLRRVFGNPAPPGKEIREFRADCVETLVALRVAPNFFLKIGIEDINTEISDTDGMALKGETARKHYFSVGASALNVINSVLALAQVNSPKTILDFGCGAGRVTRWLHAAFPQAAISGCDLREGDLAFVHNNLGASTWVSGTDVANLQQPSSLDLIWVGSVVTHLDEAAGEALVRKLAEWLKPGGLLIASLHGRTACTYGNSGKVKYIRDDLWPRILIGYHANGYGYCDYPGQKGYGISLTSPEWVMSLAQRLEGTRLVYFGEAVWDGHHDIVALQRL